MYSYEEYADLVFVYGFCNGNGRAAVEECRWRCPHRTVPHPSTFANGYRCWRETGFCPCASREHVQQRRNDNVLDAVQRSPNSSFHRISHTTGIPPTQVWRILHSDGLSIPSTESPTPLASRLCTSYGILWMALGKFGFASTNLIQRWSYVHPWWHK
jgi:hypothetical protein